MFVKQIDMKEAFQLASKGMEIKVLVPTGPGTGWISMEPDTLQNVLADVLFFRSEPAMEKTEFGAEVFEELVDPEEEESGKESEPPPLKS